MGFKEGACQKLRRLLSYQVANISGIGKRKNQEDDFGFVNSMDVTEMRLKGLLALVADGIGGMEGGELASLETKTGIRWDFQLFDMEQDILPQMEDSIQRVNEGVYKRFEGRIGSTLVECLFFREHLYFCSVGDSFIFLYRDGGLFRLNQEHNVKQKLYLNAIRDQSMDPREAQSDQRRDSVTQYIGMSRACEIDCALRPLRLRNGDIVLLCSDGVGDVLSKEELILCMKEETAENICRRIEREVLEKDIPMQDNYTALVICCGY